MSRSYHVNDDDDQNSSTATPSSPGKRAKHNHDASESSTIHSLDPSSLYPPPSPPRGDEYDDSYIHSRSNSASAGDIFSITSNRAVSIMSGNESSQLDSDYESFSLVSSSMSRVTSTEECLSRVNSNFSTCSAASIDSAASEASPNSSRRDKKLRAINFNLLETLTSFPRYPDQDLCVDLESIDRDDALIVFVSHCWLRGYPGAEGYDGRPHPDNATHDKFRLTLLGIKQIWQLYAPDMKNCYIWMDFGCIDQEHNPAGELKFLTDIVKLSDCLFTPIHSDNPNREDMVKNYYKEYKAVSWNTDQHSYVNRGWCRVEMFYASNIPVDVIADRQSKFRFGLYNNYKNGIRPHYLYGLREKSMGRPPILLPPLRNNLYEELDPCTGHVTREKDKVKIAGLVEVLRPYMIAPKVGYFGAFDENGKKSGNGIYRFPNGSVYDGEWKDDVFHGKGCYTLPNTTCYEGDFYMGQRHGQGNWNSANGNKSGGSMINDFQEGLGWYQYAITGDRYEGLFKKNNRWGWGVYKYGNGNRYDGDFYDNLCHGNGTYTFANGNVFSGIFENNKFQVGTLYHKEKSSTFNAICWPDDAALSSNLTLQRSLSLVRAPSDGSEMGRTVSALSRQLSVGSFSPTNSSTTDARDMMALIQSTKFHIILTDQHNNEEVFRGIFKEGLLYDDPDPSPRVENYLQSPAAAAAFATMSGGGGGGGGYLGDEEKEK